MNLSSLFMRAECERPLLAESGRSNVAGMLCRPNRDYQQFSVN